MKKRKTFRGFFALIALLMGVTSVGFSSWMLEKAEYEKGVAVTKTPEIAVCYNDKTRKKYTTIEKALSEASGGDNIYVIPGLKDENNSLYEIKITSNCTIKSGVSLELPYEDDGSSTHKISVDNDFSDNEGFADVNSNKVATYRKTLVSIAEGTVLTIEPGATLEIGAIIGTKTAIPSAHVKSSYCEILLKANAKIENQGTLNIYGYIKEDSTNNGSSVRHYSGSTVYMPLVFYDFRGGSFSTAANGVNVMPFNSFDFPNCQILQRYDYGSKMSAFAGIYLTEQGIDIPFLGHVTVLPEGVNIATATVISSGNEKCLFKLSSGYFTMKYTPANCKYTTNDVLAATTEKTANLTTIHLYGDLSVSSFAINIANVVNIDTAKMLCPISYKYRIFVDQGNLSIDTMIKFLGGSSLNIGPSGSAEFNKQVVFYQNYIPPIKTVANLYPSVYKTAEFINNGLLTVNDGFGGFVGTTEDTGLSMISNGITTSVSSTEVIAASRDGTTGKVDESESHTEAAKALISSGDENEPTEQNLIAGKIYKSAGTYWKIAGKDILSVALSISSGESNQGESKTYSIKANLNPNPYDSTDVHFNWLCDDPEATISGNDTDQISFTTPANKTYEDKIYALTCEVTFKKTDGTDGSVSATGEFTAKKSVDIGSVSLSPSSGESKPGEANEYSIKATFTPITHNSEVLGYEWSCDRSDATISGNGTSQISFKTPANLSSSEIVYTLSCTVTFRKANGEIATMTATGTYTARKPSDISGVEIVCNKTSVANGASGSNRTITANIEITPTVYVGEITDYIWAITDGLQITGQGTPSASVTLPANSKSSDKDYTLSCTVKFIRSDGTKDERSDEVILTAEGKGCLIKGTSITMADGSIKNIEDIKITDKLLSYNMFTRQIEGKDIVFYEKGYGLVDIIALKFDDGHAIKLAQEHMLFDRDLNRYVMFNSEQGNEYIGHEFVVIENNYVSTTKLISVENIVEEAEYYSLVTCNNFNVIANGLMTNIPPYEIYNYLTMDKYELGYDLAQLERDIAEYGLYEYEVFEPYGATRKLYEAYNAKYLKIAVGKGILTFEDILEIIERFSDNLLS